MLDGGDVGGSKRNEVGELKSASAMVSSIFGGEGVPADSKFGRLLALLCER